MEALEGRVSLARWLRKKMNAWHWEFNPGMVTHVSTKWARCRLTSLIESKVLPLCQITSTDTIANEYADIAMCGGVFL